jgi:hypothetical protein
MPNFIRLVQCPIELPFCPCSYHHWLPPHERCHHVRIIIGFRHMSVVQRGVRSRNCIINDFPRLDNVTEQLRKGAVRAIRNTVS